MLPGRIMLWWTYQNPSGGIAGVAKTGRNYRSPLFTFLTSTVFWAAGAVFLADGSGGFDFGSSGSSNGLVKPGSSYSAPATPSRPSSSVATKTLSPTSSRGSAGPSGDTACEKAKKAAAAASSLDELELAKAKVNALC